MEYSAVEKVNPTISENEYVTRDVRKRRQILKPLLKKLDAFDVAIIFVSICVAVSLGFAVAGLVKAFSGTETVVNAISAVLK